VDDERRKNHIGSELNYFTKRIEACKDMHNFQRSLEKVTVYIICKSQGLAQKAMLLKNLIHLKMKNGDMRILLISLTPSMS